MFRYVQIPMYQQSDTIDLYKYKTWFVFNYLCTCTPSSIFFHLCRLLIFDASAPSILRAHGTTNVKGALLIDLFRSFGICKVKRTIYKAVLGYCTWNVWWYNFQKVTRLYPNMKLKALVEKPRKTFSTCHNHWKLSRCLSFVPIGCFWQHKTAKKQQNSSNLSYLITYPWQPWYINMVLYQPLLATQVTLRALMRKSVPGGSHDLFTRISLFTARMVPRILGACLRGDGLWWVMIS